MAEKALAYTPANETEGDEHPMFGNKHMTLLRGVWTDRKYHKGEIVALDASDDAVLNLVANGVARPPTSEDIETHNAIQEEERDRLNHGMSFDPPVAAAAAPTAEQIKAFLEANGLVVMPVPAKK